MKKSFHNNNLIKKRNQNIIYIDNKNLNKYNEKKPQDKKEIQISKNKNLIINNFNSNINNKQRLIKTAKGSPLSINNKILKHISKITNQQTNKNIDKIPTVILNINSNQIIDKNYKNIQNANESKSKSNKSKSNENNKNKIIYFKKTSNQNNIIKKENNYNYNNNIIKTKTQMPKKQIKMINNNLHKNMINKNQINDNSYKTNQYQFSYNNNQKLNIGTSLSLTQNKINFGGFHYINNIINKNNNINSFKATSITTKNSIKNSKEKNYQNSIIHHKSDNSNENKKIDDIKNKKISNGAKIKINQQKLIIQNNNNNLKSLMQKFSKSNANNNKKDNNDFKYKNIDNLSNSKNITTLLGKKNNSNLSSLSNFYSINILSKSFANSKKNFNKNINFYKTKVETKSQNNDNDLKKTNKYYENINNNNNIFPITISNYKNNYININININSKNSKKNNIKVSNNNICHINKIMTNNKNNSKNKNSNLKLNDFSKKKTLSSNNTKIMNKINNKYQINDLKMRLHKNNIINNMNTNTNTNTNNNNLKIKELSCFDLKKTNMPITLTSSLLQTESYGKSKEFKKIDLKQVLHKFNCINEKKKKLINHNLTNNENNNNLNIDIININSNSSGKNDINNNTITNQNELSTISQKDYNYYNDESLKLIKEIKKYGKEHNYNNYSKTNLNYYKIGRSIGHGAFGKVNIALHVLSGHIVAIKSFNKIKNTFPINKIYYEIKLLKKLRNHKNIIKYFEHFENEKHFFIVMENISGGNLLNAINKMSKFSEMMAKNIFRQLINTIKYLHSIGIVHRDIKPDNILLELDNTIKLCDFGVSKEVKENQLLTDSCGTPAFVAPEILKDSPYNPYMTDIWSSGVVLYAMITGFFPFRGVNETELHKNILSGMFPKLKDVSNELKDLLNKILEVNPNKRINIDNILNHPWLNEGNTSINNINNNYNYFNTNINIFTKAEKIIYGKLKIDYRKANKEDILENFTYHNMETDFEEENQNIKSISFIKTPYNSRRPRDDEEDLYYDDVNIENNIMKFLSKVGEISRLYEVHNNIDFDQGFIIPKKDLNNKQRLMSSKNNSYENEKLKVEKKRNENKKEVNDDNNNLIENICNSNEDKNNKEKNINNNSKIFNINKKVLKFVENFGYKREFIIKSLQLNENNHAIATYYLGLSLLNG